MTWRSQEEIIKDWIDSEHKQAKEMERWAFVFAVLWLVCVVIML